MADYDLSTYAGRQAARDAGNWVGTNSSGQIVMERTSGGGGGSAPAPSAPGPQSPTGGGGEQVYQTVNGPRTLAEMGRELMSAGWPGATFGDQANVNQQILAAYTQTTGGQVTPAAPGTPTTGGTPAAPGTPNYGGPDTGYNPQAASLLATTAQQKAYQAYLNAKLNLETEQQAFDHAQQAFTNEITKSGLTGQYGGQATQAAMQYGANTFGTWGQPVQGQQTLAAQSQQWNQQLQAIQEARAAQNQQQQQAQAYLSLLSGMRGPQDYFQYQNVLGSTPQGMKDLVSAAMGQYVPGGGATTGVTPTAASLQGLQQQIAGTGNGTNTMGANQMNLPAPNQISAQAWKNLAPSQQQLLTSAYEAQGWNKEDVGALLNQSLPKYATNAPMAGTWRLNQ
jgi:hypothetical protein